MKSLWKFFVCTTLHLNTYFAACHGGAEDMKSLLNATLANYNKLVIPRRSYNRPLEVQARLVIPFIETLDVKNQLLKFIGVFNLVWTDEFLRWDPADYGQITNIVIPSSLIWTPNLLIVNAKNNPFESRNEAQAVNILSNGTVLYTPTASMEIPCKHADISKFPFDHHICGPQLSAWMYDNTSVQIVIPDDAISLQNFADNGQFVVTPGHVEQTEYDYGGRFFESKVFLLHLTRRPAYMSLTLLLPVCLISLLEGVSLVMSPDEPEKLSISITILLSFTVFLGVINENLPETSENISLMVVYITGLQLLAFLVVIGNAIVYREHQKKSIFNTNRPKGRISPEKATNLDNNNKDVHSLNGSLNVDCSPNVVAVSEPQDAPTGVSRADVLNTYFSIISFTLFIVLTVVLLTIAAF